MTRLSWASADRDYESGLDRGVFYPLGGPGHVWNGLVSVEESPTEGETSPLYLDGLRLSNRKGRGEFAASIGAFTYPTVVSSGLVAPRRPTRFDMTYRVRTLKGYKIHLVYNALATPSENNYHFEDVSNFSWTITTRATKILENIHVSHLIIDTAQAYPHTIEALEEILYGSEAGPSRMPTPQEVLEVFEENSILRIIDHGDGSWTAIGPDDVVIDNGDGSFIIDWPSAVWISSDTYTVHSL